MENRNENIGWKGYRDIRHFELCNLFIKNIMMARSPCCESLGKEKWNKLKTKMDDK